MDALASEVKSLRRPGCGLAPSYTAPPGQAKRGAASNLDHHRVSSRQQKQPHAASTRNGCRNAGKQLKVS